MADQTPAEPVPKEPAPAPKRWSRRRVLSAAALALPAATAAAALSSVGRAALAAKDGTAEFAGDPLVWRRRFLAEAQRSRSATTVLAPEPADTPVSVPVAAPAAVETAHAPDAASVATPQGELMRMQADLKRAMTKPRNQRKWNMVIDLRKCIGCSACTIACKAENHLPPGIVYRPVIDQEEGEYPSVARYFLPRPCMHCDKPPCTDVCPVNATWKRDDGIVVIDYNRCIGCRYCMSACPYSARYFDFGDYYTKSTPASQTYEEMDSPEYGRRWNRRNKASPVGNARKCHFCIHRLDAGMLPACVTTCIGGATYFGDRNDPESLVSEVATRGTASGKAMRLKEELGTEPKVLYLL